MTTRHSWGAAFVILSAVTAFHIAYLWLCFWNGGVWHVPNYYFKGLIILSDLYFVLLVWDFGKSRFDGADPRTPSESHSDRRWSGYSLLKNLSRFLEDLSYFTYSTGIERFNTIKNQNVKYGKYFLKNNILHKKLPMLLIKFTFFYVRISQYFTVFHNIIYSLGSAASSAGSEASYSEAESCSGGSWSAQVDPDQLLGLGVRTRTCLGIFDS